jgi:hypothetical protein
VIGTQQPRKMESSSASALRVGVPETIRAAGNVAAWETNTSGPLRASEARGVLKSNVSSQREMSTSRGAWETNRPERETAVARVDEELLTSAAQVRRQTEAAARDNQAAAGERTSPSAREQQPKGALLNTVAKKPQKKRQRLQSELSDTAAGRPRDNNSNRESGKMQRSMGVQLLGTAAEMLRLLSKSGMVSQEELYKELGQQPMTAEMPQMPTKLLRAIAELIRLLSRSGIVSYE